MGSIVDRGVQNFTDQIPKEQQEKLSRMLNGLGKQLAQLTDDQKGKLTEVLKQKGHEINVAELPQLLLHEFQSLQARAEGFQLSIFDRRKIDRSLPLQQLIQAETHGERLRILEASLRSEKARLEEEVHEAPEISLPEALRQRPRYSSGSSLSKL